MLFLQYPPCSTCKKAKSWLDEHSLSYTDRHIKEDNPSYEELNCWLEASGLPVKKFFNTSGLHRQRWCRCSASGPGTGIWYS